MNEFRGISEQTSLSIADTTRMDEHPAAGRTMRGALDTIAEIIIDDDPATTSPYDQRGKWAQHKATSLLHVPYKKRL